MSHGLQFVRRTIGLLGAAGAQCWLFGGWAEELQGLCPARAHRDVDLLYRAEDFSVMERLLRDHELEEVQDKRFDHKRAFVLDAVMVELFLVERDDRGLFTSFWAQSRHDWPADVLSSASDLRVASAAALGGYRAKHSALRPVPSTTTPNGGGGPSVPAAVTGVDALGGRAGAPERLADDGAGDPECVAAVGQISDREEHGHHAPVPVYDR